ncbi:hypothetical protein PR202_gb24445 [Eleusine coracana subsp. coracana]|uniref:non-specific serine/threonine protein kinase n=1 Tax=Eleusine coracana subsp. coracana TaxID=191504 RepID=A0AAV5FMG2_ELECO|nr:hypothetical protein QOZ80_5BG0448550 [Eleusine coracana subsp. coracana]GJN35650.1 hypothetical protein PR202_gb24445 [Eleusine coracana subsp. coracana]
MAAAPQFLLVVVVVVLVAAVGGAEARMVPVEYLYPPFNLSYFHFIDTNGVFLVSPHSNFSAAVYNAGSIASSDTQSRFFFSVVHSATRTPVWTATSPSTILESVILSLSSRGLSLFDPSSSSSSSGADSPPPAWSTPPLPRPATALRLLDTGELRLIDGENATLWSSFERPTDTLVVPGQELRVGGVPLTCSTSERDLTPGAYRLVLTRNDALLQWGPTNVTYWALSSDPAAVQDSTHDVASMVANATGLYLLAANKRDTVYRLLFSPPSSPFFSTTGNNSGGVLIVKVDPSGRLRAMTLTAGGSSSVWWSAPANDCDLPLTCGSLGICTNSGGAGNGSTTCGCPDAFSTYSSGGCAPADGSSVLPVNGTCNEENKYSSSSNYVGLGAGIGYLPNKFTVPDTSGDSLPACRDLCSANCSCLGFFYRNSSSKSCFLLHNQIGSVFRTTTTDNQQMGFIKTTLPPNSQPHRSNKNNNKLSFITIVFGIVLPTVAAVFVAFLLYAMGAHWLNKKKPPPPNQLNKKSGGGGSWFRLPAMLSYSSSSSSSSSSRRRRLGNNQKVDQEEDKEKEEEEVLIPGLPTRFTYSDLDTATDGFQWQIGCGGFGSVFRGELPDRSTVAVKRMNNSQQGQQRRREFLTEIAVIGNVHHVNLVKLRGFCAEGTAGRHNNLLVYEFMNRGSLDQSLFRRNLATVMEWPARLRVCVGAARGLAYLHAGCDRKILHCDVKPENILLDDNGAVKIADFGLAKLMTPEQSGLFTTMRGTRGYLAPEWLMNAPITDKADVYSFGMVLLEIVRGRKNSSYNNNNSKEEDDDDDEESASEGSSDSTTYNKKNRKKRSSYFPALALDLHEQGRYSELLDPRLEGRANVDEVARVIKVALCCLHEDAALRPNMTAVSAMLDGTMDVADPRVDLLRYLRMYGRGLVDVRPLPVGWMDDNRGSNTTAAASSSWSPPSCISAQQLSGPR